jgi:PPOX class probable F420-dependent enzyme
MAELSDEVAEFLSAGTRTAMLGYLAADGRPLVAPVWFIVDNGEPVFNTGRASAKGRALVRDSRVVICVDDPHPPYSFVQVQGIASVHDGNEDLLEIPLLAYLFAPKATAKSVVTLHNWIRSRRRREVATLLAAVGCVFLAVGRAGL